MPAHPSPRALAAPSLAVLALALAGCTYTAPMETTRSMIPGDGRNFTLAQEGVEVSSALIVSSGEGEPGVLVASVINDGDEPVSVTITGAGLDEDVDVPVGRTARLGQVDSDPSAQEVVIDSVPQAPGYLVPLTFSTGDGSEQEVPIPVLDGTFPRYEPYLAALDEG